MKVFIVLCLAIVPILGHLIPTTNSEPPAVKFHQISPKVANGNLAFDTQFPWLVSIQPVTNVMARCSGSLISSNRILTAAHWVRDYTSFNLGFGSTNINMPLITQMVSRANIVIHPRFNNVTLNNDIAIVRLNYDVQFSRHVKPIRLPRRTQNDLDYFSYKIATISGWGRTTDDSMDLSEVLQFADLNVTTNAYCKSLYVDEVIVSSTLCGFGVTKTSGPCGGDSGSPLVITDMDGVATQIGLFSFVTVFGCTYGYPAGFTNAASHLDWISQNTGIPIIE